MSMLETIRNHLAERSASVKPRFDELPASLRLQTLIVQILEFPESQNEQMVVKVVHCSSKKVDPDKNWFMRMTPAMVSLFLKKLSAYDAIESKRKLIGAHLELRRYGNTLRPIYELYLNEVEK